MASSTAFWSISLVAVPLVASPAFAFEDGPYAVRQGEDALQIGAAWARDATTNRWGRAAREARGETTEIEARLTARPEQWFGVNATGGGVALTRATGEGGGGLALDVANRRPAGRQRDVAARAGESALSEDALRRVAGGVSQAGGVLGAGQAFSLSGSISARQPGGGLEVELGSRGRVAYDNDNNSVAGAGIGAFIRFGKNLRTPRNPRTQRGWYVFAGADATALTVKLDGELEFDDRMRVEERLIVGDAQAGVGWRFGVSELSVAYMRREMAGGNRVFNARDTEEFFGISFTMTR